MRRTTLSICAILTGLLLFALSTVGQPSVSSVGAIEEGNSVWWSVDGVGVLNITPAHSTGFDDVSLDFTKSDLFSSSSSDMEVSIRIEKNLGGWRAFKKENHDVNVSKLVCETVSGVSVNGTANDTVSCEIVQEVQNLEWKELDVSKSTEGSSFVYAFVTKNTDELKVIPPHFVGSGLSYKYDVTFDFGSAEITVDPTVNGTDIPAVNVSLEFEGDFTDSSNYGYHATVNNDVGISSNPSKFGIGSASFGVTGDNYLNLTNLSKDSLIYNFTGSNWTIAVWVYPNTSSTYRAIFSDYILNSANKRGTYYRLWPSGPADRMGYSYMKNDGTELFAITSDTVPLDTWSYFVARFNGTHHSVYIDGNSMSGGVSASTIPALDSGAPPILGWCIHEEGGQCEWRGFMDRFCFWDQYINDSQIRVLYNNGDGNVCAAGPGSIANESQGVDAIKTAIDSSVPSATQYVTQQVYVVNSSNNQNTGVVDYLVVQNSPQRRWLLNYVTSGESYLNAGNLSNTLYVLELTDKTQNEIIAEVSALLNSTK